MRSNGLLKWLTIPLVLVVVFVSIRLFSDAPVVAPATQATGASAPDLTPSEMTALGIEGDSPEDTVATLVAQVKQLREELSEAVSTNKRQQAENERLRLRDRTIDQRIETAVSRERDEWLRTAEQDRADQQQQTNNLFEELRSRLDSGTVDANNDLPIGFGLDGQDSKETAGSEVLWIDPMDLQRKSSDSRRSDSAESKDVTSPSSFAAAADSASDTWNSVSKAVSDTARSAIRETGSEPVYTIPPDATLVGAVAMTALIGRVPVDGAVVDAFPFKVIVGPDNLTANGIELPDLAGAIVSGTASGDWTFSCVRGEIKSITFVFQDGTIASSRESSGRNNRGDTQRSLGYLSDPHGVPCVSGTKRSNAQEYLTSQLLITAAGAGAASLIDSTSGNFSYVTGNNGQTLGTVGITGNEALERILAGGVHEASQWANKLYGQAFAAVYVPPTARVAIHIQEQINIDYDNGGRKVSHRLGEHHDTQME